MEPAGTPEGVPAPGWKNLTPETTATITKRLVGDNAKAAQPLKEDGAANAGNVRLERADDA